MKKRYLALLALLIMTAVLAGCSNTGVTGTVDLPPMEAELFTDAEKVFALYNQVTFDDTVDTIAERLGEPTKETSENGDYWLWQNEDGAGVGAVFFDNGKLRSKVVVFEDIRQFELLSNTQSFENVAFLQEGMEPLTVAAAFGSEGIEIMRMLTDSGADGVEQYLLLWVMEGGSIAQCMFAEGDAGLQQVSYSLGNVIK